MNYRYSRGSVWKMNLLGYKNSSVQAGYRPVVIISSGVGIATNDTVMVVPLTTKEKDIQVNVEISSLQGVRQWALTNQIHTVPRRELNQWVGDLCSEDIKKIETGILLSMGIAKTVVDGVKAGQEALAEAKRDREELERLIPQAREIIQKLSEITSRVDGRKQKIKEASKINRVRTKRSKEEICHFIKEWADKRNDRSEVMEAFGFNTYAAAYAFYQAHKNDRLEEDD